MQLVRLLCKVHRDSEVGELLESYISQSAGVPPGSYRIREPSSVPRELRKVLSEAVKARRTWSCWAHGGRTWLFTCNLSRLLSRARGAPVLEVSVYDNEGELRDCGDWMPDQHGRWCRGSDSPQPGRM